MSLAEFDVTGQKVLVVGAGRGIGMVIALAFAEGGADVAFASLMRRSGLWAGLPFR